MKYSEIAAINVNEHVEKKQNLSYLSWSWAVDRLLRLDENASWEYAEPKQCGNDTMMVFCSVTAFGRTRMAQLPVMDHRNKAISNPDAFQINVAMQRCLAKAIALHGLGLYIYAGEDLPEGEKEIKPEVKAELPKDESAEVFSGEIDVPEKLGEADAVEFVCNFVTEFIPTINDTDGLRSFWKSNKTQLNRVQAFSKPKFAALEAAFKTRAGELK
jgi:hypothetical protein